MREGRSIVRPAKQCEPRSESPEVFCEPTKCVRVYESFTGDFLPSTATTGANFIP